MMRITGLSHLFKWENLHNWWLTKYFFAPLYVPGIFTSDLYMKAMVLLSENMNCTKTKYITVIQKTAAYCHSATNISLSLGCIVCFGFGGGEDLLISYIS